MSFLRHPVRLTLVPYLIGTLVLAWALTAQTPLGMLPSWLVAANFSVLPVWWIDKRQAKKEGLRVPESTLHLISLVGGAGGALVAMNTFRHKTRKALFWVLNIALLLGHLAGLTWFYSG